MEEPEAAIGDLCFPALEDGLLGISIPSNTSRDCFVDLIDGGDVEDGGEERSEEWAAVVGGRAADMDAAFRVLVANRASTSWVIGAWGCDRTRPGPFPAFRLPLAGTYSSSLSEALLSITSIPSSGSSLASIP